jgi:hypothetical protein
MRDEVLKLLKSYYEKNNIECEIGGDGKIHFPSVEDIITSRVIFFSLCQKHNIAEKVANIIESEDKDSVLSVGVSNLYFKKEMSKKIVDEILDSFMLEALREELNV